MLVLVLAAVIASARPGIGATTSTVVSATVPSATSLTTTNCAPGSAGRTDLGTVLPGATSIGETGCQLTFGSSNDTARLRMFQPDGTGAAMYLPFTGSVDPGFGTGGYLAGSVTAGDDWYVDGVRLPDGGGYLLLGESDAASDDIFVEKRDVDWNLDTGYGVGGRRVLSAGGGDRAGRITLDGAGRAVVFAKEGPFDLYVYRLTPTGSLDGSFGTGGVLDTNVTSQSRASGAVLADGRIVVGASDDAGANRDAFAHVYLPSGAPDTSVGPGGRTTTLDVNGHDDMRDVIATADGGAYLLVQTQHNGADAVVFKLAASGALDTSWGTGGRTPYAIDDCCAYVPSDMAVDASGRILVAGYVNGAANDWWVARFTSAGALDTSFGAGGSVIRDPASISSRDNRLLVADDGTIVLGVGQHEWPDAVGDMGGRIVRMDDTGATQRLDGGSKYVNLHHAGSSNSSVFLPLQGPDGSLLALGYTHVSGDVQPMAVRLGSATINQYATGSDHDFDSATNSAFGACLVSAGAASAAAPWAVHGAAGCEADDVANWQPVAATAAAATGHVATADAMSATSTVLLRFGLRAAPTTPAGSWVAPITFEVLAP